MEGQELIQAVEALKKSIQAIDVSLEELEDALGDLADAMRKSADAIPQFTEEAEEAKKEPTCRRVHRRHPKKNVITKMRLSDKRNRIFHCRNSC